MTVTRLHALGCPVRRPVRGGEGTDMTRSFTAYVEFDEESGLYVGVVPELPGAHTQAAGLDQLQANLREVVALCLQELGSEADSLPRFVGLQRVDVVA